MTGTASAADMSRSCRWTRRVPKEKRLSSSTAATEVSSILSGGFNRRSSSSLDMSDLSVSFCEPIVKVQPEESHADIIALKVAELDNKFKSEGRHIRQQRRKVRIHEAREDYLACLEALSTTTKASQASNFEFFAENGLLDWKEYKL